MAEYLPRLPEEASHAASAHGDRDQTVRLREADVLADVRRLSDTLMMAVNRFRDDSRIATLAVREIPDARLSLDHVLALTEQAAHRTLELMEKSVPLADATARRCASLAATLDERSHNEIRVFLADTGDNLEAMRGNLHEVMLAQGFQDITGQILRSVHALIGEVEEVLAGLTGLTGGEEGEVPKDGAALAGPAVPGVSRDVVADQADVDDLMASMGL